jgi:hypothetical protein
MLLGGHRNRRWNFSVQQPKKADLQLFRLLSLSQEADFFISFLPITMTLDYLLLIWDTLWWM